MKKIPLVNSDKFVLVDDEDYSLLSRFKWRLNYHGYAEMVGQMQHAIAGPPRKGKLLDHGNGDRLDNRRGNLKFKTPSESNHNRRKWGYTSVGSSRFIGVYGNNGGKKWNARIMVSGKILRLGSFNTEVEAAMAYDRTAKKHFGDFARTNIKRFPRLPKERHVS